MINQLDGPPALLRNVSASISSVDLALRAMPSGPPFISLREGFVSGYVLSGGSYASSNDQRVLFGLGGATTLELAEVHSPNGPVQKITKSLPIDRYYLL